MRAAITAVVLCLALAGCGPMRRTPSEVPVEFMTDPEGAGVWVDGKLAGTTPLQTSFSWPKHLLSRQIEFRLDGYFPEVRTISRSTAILAVQMQDASDMMAFRIETDPPGAALEVNGRQAGITPLEIRVSAKEARHLVRATLAGYRAEEVVVERNRKGEPVKLKLKPAIPRLP
jgi:hypothetical protein